MEKYVLRTDKVIDEENVTHTVYGVDVPSENISIPDIFCDLACAEKFVETCNKLELSPLHLRDVIDDIL